MLRLHLTAADIGRTRLTLLGPLAETQLALSTAQHRGEDDLLGGWRRRVRSQLHGEARELAVGIAHPAGPLDLLTVAGPADRLDDGLDRLTARRGLIAAEIADAPDGLRARIPRFVAGAARGEAQATASLTAAFRTAHRVSVAPHWDRIERVLTAERAAKATEMVTGGTDALLGSLHPGVRWRPPVLEVDYRPHTPGRTDIHLCGQGLLLAPSALARSIHLYLPLHEDEQLLLVYPVLRDTLAAARVLTADAPGGRALDALIGTTRAAVLRTADGGTTTGDLARRLGISAGGASQHATVLRDAGLLHSHRLGRRIQHTLTPLGEALLSRDDRTST
ncbi:winged helix-turn-helix domain-containing protein [Kitasatospora terrestris]|uniref:Winged helix-turn-helix domain-containing protein n=1 Tax=Kitasatospora terrestris TaxID=258051 RepID=A0ABP9EMN4_9ACTN